MKPDGTCDCTLQALSKQVDDLKAIDPCAPTIKKPLQISTTPHLKCINNKFTSYLQVHPLIAQTEVILQCAFNLAGKFSCKESFDPQSCTLSYCIHQISSVYPYFFFFKSQILQRTAHGCICIRLKMTVESSHGCSFLS